MIPSPCTKVCLMRGAYCAGCCRTLDEIARWGAMSDAERAQVLDLLPARRASELAEIPVPPAS